MPTVGVAVAVSAAGLLTGLALYKGLDYAGTKGLLAPAAAILCVVLLRFPGVCFGLMLVAVALADGEAIGVIPSGGALYDQALSSFTPPDILLMLGLAGVALRFPMNDERPQLPGPLTIPLALLTMAMLAGLVTGVTSDFGVESGDLLHRAINILYVVGVPVLAVNVLRTTRALRWFAGATALVAGLKGPIGIYGALGGGGGEVEDEVASYLSPLPNMLMLTLILGTVAGLVRKVKMPWWVLVAAPTALLALTLSYRRSFWIAGIFTIIVVAILASRHRGRAVLAIGAVALVLTVVGAATIGSSDNPSSSPLAQRAQTITPGGLGSNRGDRYRMDERKNVIENLKENPLTGIGLGVPWTVHEPLAEDHDRRYAHVAVLWFWLAMGPLGVLAYIAVLGTGLWTASRIWSRHPDPIVQVAALAGFGTLLGLIVVELTATFTGVEPRVSLYLGAVLGWLAAAWRDLPSSGKTP